MLFIPVDQNRVVLNPCKDYRPSARGYINASLIMVEYIEALVYSLSI
jgi:protein tyrosine phosphatase